MNDPAPFPPTTTFDPYRAPPHGGDSDPVLSVPYDGQPRMRLVIVSGMSGVRMRVDPDATALVSIDPGSGPAPRLRVSHGEVRVAWASSSFVGWLRAVLTAEEHDAEIVLHPSVAWELLLRGGLSRVEADLAAGVVTRIDVSGGCSHVDFVLPRPDHSVPIHISGGASHVSLRRPAGVGASISVHGGIASLRLDDRTFDAIGGAARLESSGATPDAPSYEVDVTGGAAHVEVMT